jgi:hypothetical protein
MYSSNFYWGRCWDCKNIVARCHEYERRCIRCMEKDLPAFVF